MPKVTRIDALKLADKAAAEAVALYDKQTIEQAARIARDTCIEDGDWFIERRNADRKRVFDETRKVVIGMMADLTPQGAA